MPEPVVRAAGGVVWRRVDGQVQVVLVHRPKYDDWSLPKGKLEDGEPWVVGGVREVREETGFDALPGRRLGESRYRVLHRGRDAAKTVRWWAMRCGDGAFAPSDEVDALRWVPLERALQSASAFDLPPLQALSAGPVETTTVLLVDGEAPEDVVGAYRPERVVTADRPLADLLPSLADAGGTAVVHAPAEQVRQAYGPGSWALSLAAGEVVDAAPLAD